MTPAAPRVKKRKMNDLPLTRIIEIEEQKRLGIRAMYRIPAVGGLPEFTYFNAIWPSMKEPIRFESLPDGYYELLTDEAGLPYYNWTEPQA
jgi:hypothetical protein